MAPKIFIMKADFTCTSFPATMENSTAVVDKTPATAVKISAAVGNASWERCPNYPEDVSTIQKALNKFTPSEGGPEKPLFVNGICDRQTIGAIVFFQKKWGLKNRWGIVDGIIDIEGGTIERLRKGSGHRENPLEDFMRYIPRVIEILTAARAAITLAKLPAWFSGGNPERQRIDRHFHVSQANDPDRRIEEIETIYQNMLTAIGYIPQGVIVTAEEPWQFASGSHMFTFEGGYHYSNTRLTWNTIPVSSIYLCPNARTLNRDAFVYAMIHELAHFTGAVENGIVDWAYFHLNPVKYSSLIPELAYRNADSYSQYAYEVIGMRNFNIAKNAVS